MVYVLCCVTLSVLDGCEVDKFFLISLFVLSRGGIFLVYGCLFCLFCYVQSIILEEFEY